MYKFLLACMLLLVGVGAVSAQGKLKATDFNFTSAPTNEVEFKLISTHIHAQEEVKDTPWEYEANTDKWFKWFKQGGSWYRDYYQPPVTKQAYTYQQPVYYYYQPPQYQIAPMTGFFGGGGGCAGGG
jgi:hypothetical protein